MPKRAGRADLEAALRRLRQPLYRQSALLIAGAAVTSATGFVFWLAAARLVDPSELGTAAGLVAAVALINYLTGLGLPQGLLRYSGHFRVSVSELANAAMLITAATSLVGGLVFAAGAPLWAPALQHDLSTPLDLALFSIFNIGVSVGLVLDSALTARRRGQWVLARATMMSVGKLAVLPLAAAGGAIGLYVAMEAPIVVATAVIYLALPVVLPTFRRGALAASEAAGEFIDFSLRTFPSNLFAGAPLLLPLLVSGLLGSRQTAFFYIAWSFAAILQLAPTLISQVSLSEAPWQDPWTTAARARRFALGLVVPAVAVILVAAPLILSIYGPAYEDNAALSLRALALAVLPWCFFSISISFLRAHDRHLAVAGCSAAFAVAGLTGAVAGALLGDLDGLALGWLAGTALVALGIEIRIHSSMRHLGATREGVASRPARAAPEIDEHRLVFVGGLHRSGAAALARSIAQHPEVSGFDEVGAATDEGQHLQSVYPADPFFGGPGRFAFAPDAHLTEQSPLSTEESRLALWGAWRDHWDLEKRVLVERSPPNLIQARFLQALFPGSALVLIMRHPIAVSEATREWGHRMIRAVKPPGLVRHWLTAHETLLSDAPALANVILVRYEDLVRAPGETLQEVFEFLGLSPHDLPPDPVARDDNPEYFRTWPGGQGANRWGSRQMAQWIVRRYERRTLAFGYSLLQPNDVLEADERVQALLRGQRLPETRMID